MQEKYFINVIDTEKDPPYHWMKNPKPKINKDGYTWKQLLYWCYNIINKSHHASKRWRYENIRPINEYHLVDSFFSNFRNNPNDGSRSCGKWVDTIISVENAVLCGPIRKDSERYFKITHYRSEWVRGEFTPNKYQVTDNFGRIISSGYIRAEYMKYVYSSDDAIEIKQPYWRSAGTSRYQKGRWWHKYRGDHCGGKPWKRAWYASRIEQKEVKKEYGVTFKQPNKIPYPYCSSYQRGWKRSRKQKQWMKFGWKKMYNKLY